MMGAFSLWHWLVVLLVMILVFGTKRLRNVGADLGATLRDFRDRLREIYGATKKQSPSLCTPSVE